MRGSAVPEPRFSAQTKSTLPSNARVRFDVLEADKRPVMADADSRVSVRKVRTVEIRSEPGVRHRILFDPGHGLEERITREQFV